MTTLQNISQALSDGIAIYEDELITVTTELEKSREELYEVLTLIITNPEFTIEEVEQIPQPTGDVVVHYSVGHEELEKKRSVFVVEENE